MQVIAFAIEHHPHRALAHPEFIAGITVALVSTSPEREDMILVRDPFAD